MTDSPRTIRERINELTAQEMRPTPAPDPARDQAVAALEETLASSWNEAFGVDPMIDKALKDVRQRAQEVTSTLEDIDLSRREARAGREDPEKTEASIQKALDAETRATEATIAAARKALEIGRDRLIRELIPEPTRGTTSSEAKADIKLMVEGFENALDGFRYAITRAIEADDRTALGLLAGTYGESLYRARGGSPEGFAGLRAELLKLAGDAASRRSPRSTEARKWKVALTDPAGRYVTGEGTRTSMRLKDVPR